MVEEEQKFDRKKFFKKLAEFLVTVITAAITAFGTGSCSGIHA